MQFLNYTNDKRNPFTSSSTPGDSGSGVYVYDKMDKKWYLVGVVSTSNCNAHFTDGYTCSQVDYALINQAKINEFQNTHKVTIGFGTYTLSSDGLMKDGKKIENAKLNFQGHARIHAYVSQEQAKKLQEHGLSALTKSVSFTQKIGKIGFLF